MTIRDAFKKMRDRTVPLDNISLIKAALRKAGNTHVTMKIFPNVIYLFQTCETGKIDDHNKIGETIAPVVLNKISDWINSLN